MRLEIKLKKKTIFAPLLRKWVPLTRQEKIRQEYVCYLVNEYNLSLEQMAQEQKLTQVGQLQGPAVADIVVWKSKRDRDNHASPMIVLECKVAHIPVRPEDYFRGYHYAWLTGASLLVAANKLERRIFKVAEEYMFPKLEEVLNMPDEVVVHDHKKVGKSIQKNKAFTRDNFAKVLLTCHNIIRSNDKLSPEAAFDEMSKILFIKIMYERMHSKKLILSKEGLEKERQDYKQDKSLDGYSFCQFLFEKTKKNGKDANLFESSEVIKVRENSFESIIERLEEYNLGATLDDVKGIAFEKFLGRTFRGELGQFFTPRTIVDFMVEILDPKEGELICDPCCGSGGFLIKAFQYVKDKIEQKVCEKKEQVRTKYYDANYHALPDEERQKIDNKVDGIYEELNRDLDINQKNSCFSILSVESIFGVDANPRMSRTAKMNMIMHGADRYKGVYHHDGLLNTDGIFESRFDVIFTNPPFGARVNKSMKITEADQFENEEQIDHYQRRYGSVYDKALEQINQNIGKPILSLFKTGSMTGLTEVLFIERCLNLLKPGGRMGIVLPEGVLNNKQLQKVRDFIESKAKIILIASLPKDVFVASGAHIKPSLVFFRKFTSQESEAYQKVMEEVTGNVYQQFAANICHLEEQLKRKLKNRVNKITKKSIQKKLKIIKDEMTVVIRREMKCKLNYPVPIAMVKKAGISRTGACIENELNLC